MRIALGRTLGAITALLLASSCGTPQAKRVECDGKLQPINAPAPPSVRASEGARSSDAKGKRHDP